jgi:hypothetical protein
MDGSVMSSADALQLDTMMRTFYGAISFNDSCAPDWSRMTELFSAHARITRLTPEGIDYMDPVSFRGFAEELIEVGAYTSFYEHEIARRVDRFGDVIHIASAYETKISPHASDFIERGINSLQLIREKGSWRILSLCWDDHAPFAIEGFEPIAERSTING